MRRRRIDAEPSQIQQVLSTLVSASQALQPPALTGAAGERRKFANFIVDDASGQWCVAGDQQIGALARRQRCSGVKEMACAAGVPALSAEDTTPISICTAPFVR